MSLKNEHDSTNVSNSTNELGKTIQRPDLNNQGVGSNTLKGIGWGAIVGTVVLGAVECFHFVSGKKPINKITGKYLTNEEYCRDLIKSIGIVTAAGGAANFVETVSQNNIRNKLRPYVERIEAERELLLDEKAKQCSHK